MAPGLNYFTCTLGQSAKLKRESLGKSHSFETVLGLVDEQAQQASDTPALGFADFASNDGMISKNLWYCSEI